ncbi:hypothetical protein SAMN04487944_10220 [Gracilibacillus ureilyticus]|uniref:Uncharacterized protein n=1 Tax=Gracilibacillus ureilyticus TaxID=531814 RepID=A0A1H9ML83_9BACI|nr:hypothetical protein SAMN04487944_10220 [Gracilibacillus ureilyticus]
MGPSTRIQSLLKSPKNRNLLDGKSSGLASEEKAEILFGWAVDIKNGPMVWYVIIHLIKIGGKKGE